MTDKDERLTEKQEEKGLKALGKKDNIIKIVVLVGILGIGLIFFSSVSRKQQCSEGNNAASDNAQSIGVEEYRRQLTEELGSMVSSIEGAGRTKLLVTLDGTVRSVYAADEDISGRQSQKDSDKDEQNSEKRTCIVIRRRDGSEEALMIGQIMPRIRGVLVVCDGGDDADTAGRIKSAIASALNIPLTRICVSKMG